MLLGKSSFECGEMGVMGAQWQALYWQSTSGKSDYMDTECLCPADPNEWTDSSGGLPSACIQHLIYCDSESNRIHHRHPISVSSWFLILPETCCAEVSQAENIHSQLHYLIK